jgi:hypothetical protein
MLGRWMALLPELTLAWLLLAPGQAGKVSAPCGVEA